MLGLEFAKEITSHAGYCLNAKGGLLTRFPLRATLTSTRLAILMKGMPLFILLVQLFLFSRSANRRVTIHLKGIGAQSCFRWATTFHFRQDLLSGRREHSATCCFAVPLPDE